MVRLRYYSPICARPRRPASTRPPLNLPMFYVRESRALCYVAEFCKGNSLAVTQAEGYGEIVMKLGEAGSPPREITPIAEDVS